MLFVIGQSISSLITRFLISDGDWRRVTCRLISFGLNEKEAQPCLHLLKYGPKTPSPLAKSLQTCLEDVHRTLTSLIDKSVVRRSLDGVRRSRTRRSSRIDGEKA